MESENRKTVINLILENNANQSKIKEWIQRRRAIVHEVIAENTEEGNKALAVLLKYGASTTNSIPFEGGYFESSTCFQYPLRTAYINRNLTAIRMLCEHGVNEKLMLDWSEHREVSLLKNVLINRWKDTDSNGAFTDEVVQLLLRHGAVVNEPIYNPLLIAHPVNMWALAEAGADYSDAGSGFFRDKAFTVLCIRSLNFIAGVCIAHKYQLELCTLLAMGDAIENTFVPRISVTVLMIKHFCAKCSQIIVSSGHRPQHLDKFARISPELAQNVKKFTEKFNKPLSLEP